MRQCFYHKDLGTVKLHSFNIQDDQSTHSLWSTNNRIDHINVFEKRIPCQDCSVTMICRDNNSHSRSIEIKVSLKILSHVSIWAQAWILQIEPLSCFTAGSLVFAIFQDEPEARKSLQTLFLELRLWLNIFRKVFFLFAIKKRFTDF